MLGSKNWISIILLFVYATVQSQPSTMDMSFLIGKWEITHTYSPGTEKERFQKGIMNCQTVMDDQFIQCSYDIKRPGKKPALLEVFFNYNTIYDEYESLWLSSTWPVKVLERGSLEIKGEERILTGFAEFEIEEGVVEYVRDKLVMTDSSFFKRQTYIRTSRDGADVWKFHMIEEAWRVGNE